MSLVKPKFTKATNALCYMSNRNALAEGTVDGSAGLMHRLAHSALGAHNDAKPCYQRALELDPANEKNQQNLRQCEQMLRDENVS